MQGVGASTFMNGSKVYQRENGKAGAQPPTRRNRCSKMVDPCSRAANPLSYGTPTSSIFVTLEKYIKNHAPRFL